LPGINIEKCLLRFPDNMDWRITWTNGQRGWEMVNYDCKYKKSHLFLWEMMLLYLIFLLEISEAGNFMFEIHCK